MDFIHILEDNEIDCAFLTETWLKDQNSNVTALLSESGYKIFHYHRPDMKGGGVGIVTRTNVVSKNGKTFQFKTFECVTQTLNILKIGLITFVIVYRKGEESNLQFLDEFYQFTEFLHSNFNNFLICGDFNFHFNKQTDTHVLKLCNILEIFSLEQVIQGPTHVCGNTLDLVIHDPTLLNIEDVQVLQFDKSDHSLIFFNISGDLEVNDKRNVRYRNFKQVDIDSFKNDISRNVETYLGNCDSEIFSNSINTFNEIFKNVVDSHAPIINKSVQNVSRPKWIDEEFRLARSERRKYYKKWVRTRNPEDRTRYKKCRADVNDLSIEKRKAFFSKTISESQNSQRELFKICNTIMDTSKRKSLPDCENSENLANKFNSFFIDKIEKIRENISHASVNENFREYMVGKPTCAEKTMSDFTFIPRDELKKLITSKKIKTSIDDTIPAYLLNECLDEILPALEQLVNLSLRNGSVHGIKDSVVTPLIKNSRLDAEQLSNYRPVNNILYISKLVETVATLQLGTHMDINKLQVPFQSGYKSKHSCETLLLKLTSDVFNNMDTKSCCILVLLDLSAAFDTVDHIELLSILFHEIGLRGKVFDWFTSYLIGRRQAVNIKGCKSEYTGLSYGVPQGSVVGPILFNIYVRSFISMLNKAGFVVHGYADDHQILKAFCIEFQYEAIRCSVPRCLDIIAVWMKTFFLKLNSSKSQIIIFSPANLSNQVHIDNVKLSNGTNIKITNTVTNLGIKLDSQLTFAPQINSLCSHSYQLLRNLYSVQKYLEADHLRLLVQSIIVSKIDYCNSLLYGIPMYEINKLQRLQNSCARLIYGKKKNDHVTELLQMLHWLPIRQRIIFKMLTFVFKFFQQNVPEYISESLTVKNQNNCTLYSPRTNTSYGDRAFSNSAPKLWNSLPIFIRTAKSYNTFKSHLKHLLFSNFSTYIQQVNAYKT